jgi:hypothetical protein
VLFHFRRKDVTIGSSESDRCTHLTLSCHAHTLQILGFCVSLSLLHHLIAWRETVAEEKVTHSHQDFFGCCRCCRSLRLNSTGNNPHDRPAQPRPVHPCHIGTGRAMRFMV